MLLPNRSIKFRNYKPNDQQMINTDSLSSKDLHKQIENTVETQMSGVFENVLREVDERRKEEDVVG